MWISGQCSGCDLGAGLQAIQFSLNRAVPLKKKLCHESTSFSFSSLACQRTTRLRSINGLHFGESGCTVRFRGFTHNRHGCWATTVMLLESAPNTDEACILRLMRPDSAWGRSRNQVRSKSHRPVDAGQMAKSIERARLKIGSLATGCFSARFCTSDACYVS